MKQSHKISEFEGAEVSSNLSGIQPAEYALDNDEGSFTNTVA